MFRGGAAFLLCAGVLGGLAGQDDTPVRAQTPALDPCSAVATRSMRAVAVTPAQRAATEAKAGIALDHDGRYSHLDSLWADRASRTRRPRAVGVPQRSLDVGDVAVLEDAGGDMMILANPFDLADAALALTPNATGGYDIARGTFAFSQPAGTPLVLTDDDSSAVTLPFAFPFFGQSHTQVFVNSDGNLTFTRGDSASTERSVSRLVTGVPRIAPFFADLDPSAGGTVVTSGDAGAFTATWCRVPEWRDPDSVGDAGLATVQVSLFPDGAIVMQVSAHTNVRDAVVGISPGATEEFLPVDLSAPGPTAGGSRAVGERFVSTSELNLVGVSRRFLATHPDSFDGLSIFTDRELLTDSFAYEISISNRIRGIGINSYDFSREFGTTGRLQSLCNMDGLGKYPDDPNARALGEFSAAAVMAHEFGHRWLAFARIRDAAGLPSTDLLGRQDAHWNFYLDTDGSVMEGNDIEDLGDGRFRTAGAAQRFSPFDLYAMGLVDQSEVPSFFFVQEPVGLTRTRESSPRTGLQFQGTRRDVSIDEVIAALGPRVPSSAESPRVLRHAFVYVTSPGAPVDAAQVRKLDRFRLAFEQFISQATGSRLTVDTALAVR